MYFTVKLKESDLAIGVDAASYSDSLISLCRQELICLRAQLESYIILHPEFRTSLCPIQLLPSAPPIACSMAEAAQLTGVGPMAAVAGAIAQAIGEKLDSIAESVIVENGGDTYLNSRRERVVAVYAGNPNSASGWALKSVLRNSPWVYVPHLAP